MTVPLGPEGSWPLGQQVPQDGRPLDPQVPQFERPAAPAWYPTPSAPHLSAPEVLQPDRVPAKYGLMAIAAVVLVAVIGVGVAVWSMSWGPTTGAASVWTVDPTTTTRASGATSAPPIAASTLPIPSTPMPSTAGSSKSPSTAPAKTASAVKTSATTSTTSQNTLPACTQGQTISGPAWSTKVPSGWNCASSTFNASTFGLVDAQRFLIVVATGDAADAATACGSGLAKPSGTVTPLPDTVWGGRTAKVATFSEMGLEEQFRCVQVNGRVYLMMGELPEEDRSNVLAGMDALSATWLWR